MSENDKVTFFDYIFALSNRWADQTAFECHLTEASYTHKEVQDYAKNFALSLQNLDIRVGDVVAVILPNCIEFPVAFYGLLHGGYVGNLISPLFPTDRIMDMVRQVDSKVVISTPKLISEIQDLLLQENCDGESGDSITLITVAMGEKHQDTGSDTLNFDDLIRHGPEQHEASTLQKAHIDTSSDPAMILWSSGTTGTPKAIVHTHDCFTAELPQYLNSDVNVFREGHDVLLAVCPFHHGFACALQLRLSLRVGAKVITMESFKPDIFVAAVKKHKPTVLHLVLPLMDFCVNSSALTAEDFQQVRAVISSGLAMPVSLVQRFLDKFGHHILFQEMYGMTEIGGTHAIPVTHHNTKIGSVGRTLVNTEAITVDANGTELKQGEKGEVWLRGPQIRKGLFNRTCSRGNMEVQSFSSDGWLRTGDIGYHDSEGFLYITGRVKDVIKVKGFMVSPVVLEQILNTHPKVKDCAVIGIPHEVYGQVPKAFIVAADDSLTTEEIFEYMEGKVAKHEKLLGGIQFINHVPRAGIGKIARNQLVKVHESTNIMVH